MLIIEHLSVEYLRRGERIAAVRDFSLSIAPGETVGLVGESGSGKSTIALAILRLIRAQEGRITRGQILFNDTNLLRLPEPEMRKLRGAQISMVFQDPFTALNPVLRIETQLAETLGAHGLPVEQKQLKAALERVQLEPERTLRSYPHQLSGGQRQRVAIAMALLARPRLLLADEPTTALDVLVQREILDLLFALQREHPMSLLLITHDLPLVYGRTDRVAVMRAGELIEAGPSQELVRRPRAAYTAELIQSCRRLRMRQ